jgi:hypothetical protein
MIIHKRLNIILIIRVQHGKVISEKNPNLIKHIMVDIINENNLYYKLFLSLCFLSHSICSK